MGNSFEAFLFSILNLSSLFFSILSHCHILYRPFLQKLVTHNIFNDANLTKFGGWSFWSGWTVQWTDLVKCRRKDARKKVCQGCALNEGFVSCAEKSHWFGDLNICVVDKPTGWPMTRIMTEPLTEPLPDQATDLPIDLMQETNKILVIMRTSHAEGSRLSNDVICLVYLNCFEYDWAQFESWKNKAK